MSGGPFVGSRAPGQVCFALVPPRGLNALAQYQNMRQPLLVG